MVTTSPLCRIMPPASSVSRSRSICTAEAPTTQGRPMPRATTAAWLVMPPRVVRMPTAACMPCTSSGEVSTRARITVWPCALRCTASSASNTSSPVAAPGEAGSPLARTVRSASGSSVGCSSWSSWLGVDAGDRLLAADQPLLRHVDGDLERGLGRALARAGLQHEQLAFLHGELDVLKVAEMRLELGAGALQLGEGVGHQALRARAGVAPEPRREASVKGCGVRKPDDHVLALRVDQIFAVKLVGPGRRIAREDDAGRALVAAIAEHHGLDGDGSAPVVGNVMQAPIGDGARVLPGAEHGGDRAPQLGVEILREGLAELALDEGLEAGDDRRPILGRELSVVFESFEIFEVLEDLLEQLMVEAEHYVGIHLDEAAIGVVGKSCGRPSGARALRRSGR